MSTREARHGDGRPRAGHLRPAAADARRPEPDSAQLERSGANDLAAEIVQALEERGVPDGAWLVDIGRVRCALQDADSVLRRLEDAIIRVATPPR